MTKIPLVDDSLPEELQCTTCLLPMQYQKKKDGKFLWQCFKCGKQYLVSENLIFSSISLATPSVSSFSICLPALLSIFTSSLFSVD